MKRIEWNFIVLVFCINLLRFGKFSKNCLLFWFSSTFELIFLRNDAFDFFQRRCFKNFTFLVEVSIEGSTFLRIASNSWLSGITVVDVNFSPLLTFALSFLRNYRFIFLHEPLIWKLHPCRWVLDLKVNHLVSSPMLLKRHNIKNAFKIALSQVSSSIFSLTTRMVSPIRDKPKKYDTCWGKSNLKSFFLGIASSFC